MGFLITKAKVNTSIYLKIEKILFVLLCVGSACVSSSHFVDPYLQPKWYCFLFLTFIWGMISICKHWYQHKFAVDKLTLSILILSSFLLIRNVLAGNETSIEIIIACLVLYFLFKPLTKSPTPFFSVVIILCCFLQALYGLGQYFGIVTPQSNSQILGSFDNPAGFAMCIAIGLPFCFQWIIKKNTFTILFSVVVLILTVALILSELRTGIISILSILLITLYLKIAGWNKVNKFVSLICLLILFFVASISLFSLKRDSANGRIFIWKNTIAMIPDYPCLGSGPGSFHSRYMLYQAEFFKANPYSPDVLLADNVMHPYNEYLLILVEYGVLGFILCALIGFILFYYHLQLDLHALPIILVLICSFFSYPFRYPFVWVVIIYCLASLSHKIPVIVRVIDIFHYYVKMGINVFLILFIYITEKNMVFERKWKNASDLSEDGAMQNVWPIYDQLYKNWNGNPLFLYNYAVELYYLRKYAESIQVLSECQQYLNDYDVQMLFATNYYNLKYWNAVENHLKLASNMCPVRFRPLFYLFSLYKETGEKEYAINIAQKIVIKPVKINSLEVQSIKKEAKSYLQNIH